MRRASPARAPGGSERWAIFSNPGTISTTPRSARSASRFSITTCPARGSRCRPAWRSQTTRSIAGRGPRAAATGRSPPTGGGGRSLSGRRSGTGNSCTGISGSVPISRSSTRRIRTANSTTCSSGRLDYGSLRQRRIPAARRQRRARFRQQVSRPPAILVRGRDDPGRCRPAGGPGRQHRRAVDVQPPAAALRQGLCLGQILVEYGFSERVSEFQFPGPREEAVRPARRRRDDFDVGIRRDAADHDDRGAWGGRRRHCVHPGA